MEQQRGKRKQRFKKRWSELGQGVVALKRKGLEPLTNYADNLWQASWYFRNNSNYRPNWSGFMQNISKGEYLDQSKIRFLPIIDLNPTKEKCIYSTLLFIQEQAKKLNIVAPCLTFDKPLWIKTVEITKSKSMNVVCRLGGFHLLMSFLESIGKIME